MAIRVTASHPVEFFSNRLPCTIARAAKTAVPAAVAQ